MFQSHQRVPILKYYLCFGLLTWEPSIAGAENTHAILHQKLVKNDDDAFCLLIFIWNISTLHWEQTCSALLHQQLVKNDDDAEVWDSFYLLIFIWNISSIYWDQQRKITPTAKDSHRCHLCGNFQLKVWNFFSLKNYLAIQAHWV